MENVGVGQDPDEPELSRREIDVCRLVAEGRTNRQIGRALEISEKTVETYLRRIFQKAGIRSRAQVGLLLTRLAVRGDSSARDPLD